MRTRILLLCTIIAVLSAASTTSAQVYLSDKSQSGVGLTFAGAFASEGRTLGLRASGTALGLFDLGLSMARESVDGADGYWVKGVSASFMPLRSTGENVRIGLGGTAAYQMASINVPVYYYDNYGGYEFVATFDENVTTLGFLGLLEFDLNPKARLLFLFEYARLSYDKLDLSRKEYSIGFGLLTTPESGARVSVLPSVTIPSDGGQKLYGLQLAWFWQKEGRRGSRGPWSQ